LIFLLILNRIDYAKYESNISGWLKKKDSKVSRFEISFGFSKKWFSLQDSRLLYDDHELKSNGKFYFNF
jgi:hypothetical protein